MWIIPSTSFFDLNIRIFFKNSQQKQRKNASFSTFGFPKNYVAVCCISLQSVSVCHSLSETITVCHITPVAISHIILQSGAVLHSIAKSIALKFMNIIYEIY